MGGGHGRKKVIFKSQVSFEEFLYWHIFRLARYADCIGFITHLRCHEAV
jgi:hypothetical protein